MIWDAIVPYYDITVMRKQENVFDNVVWRADAKCFKLTVIKDNVINGEDIFHLISAAEIHGSVLL